MKFDNRQDELALGDSEIFQDFLANYLDKDVKETEEDTSDDEVEKILEELGDEEVEEDFEEEDLELFANLCGDLRKFSESLEDKQNYKASFAIDQTIHKVKQILEGDE
jgi:hypothetical protein